MKKLISIGVCMIFICVCLISCGKKETSSKDVENNSNAKEIETTHNSDTQQTTAHIKDTNAIERIVNCLNNLKAEGVIYTFGFYQDDMYVVLNKGNHIELVKYNIDNDESQFIDTGIEFLTNAGKGVIIQLTVKNDEVQINKKTLGIDEKEVVYGYSRDLEKLYEYTDLEKYWAYSISKEGIYFINKQDNYLYYRKSGNTTDELIRKYDMSLVNKNIFLTELYESSNSRYIFFKGNTQEGMSTKDCWGYIDLENAANDNLYDGNKSMYCSENNILVIDSSDNPMRMDENEYTGEVFFYTDGLDKSEGYLKDKLETLDSLSYEGNLFIASGGKEENKLRLYDNQMNVIYETSDIDKNWLCTAKICEKYRVLINILTEWNEDDTVVYKDIVYECY